MLFKVIRTEKSPTAWALPWAPLQDQFPGVLEDWELGAVRLYEEDLDRAD